MVAVMNSLRAARFAVSSPQAKVVPRIFARDFNIFLDFAPRPIVFVDELELDNQQSISLRRRSYR
jgi:hemolysin-activating ACP:hemolysin acyltransferase